jgi:hypothetical protein
MPIHIAQSPATLGNIVKTTKVGSFMKDPGLGHQRTGLWAMVVRSMTLSGGQYD